MTHPSAYPSFTLPVPDISAWRAGNTGVEGVWHFDSQQPGPRVLITALVHGNELCGAHAVLRLLQQGVRPAVGSLTLAFCNLAAFDTFDARANHLSRCVEQDFNRVWGPQLNAGAPTTLEQRRALALLPFVEQADCLLDLHSMHSAGPPLMLSGTLPRNIAFARSLGTPAHVVVDAGHADGVRMRDHGAFGDSNGQALALLIECGWHGDPASAEVAHDICARFLLASGVVSQPDLSVKPSLPTPDAQQVMQVTHAISARSPDTQFAKPWATGDVLRRAGTVLGWREGEAFVTPYDHCTLVMPSLQQLKPGVTVVRLARLLGAGGEPQA
jgi:predicted deacylase